MTLVETHQGAFDFGHFALFITDMMTSSNGNIFHVTGHLCGNSPVTGEFLHKGQWRGALVFSLIWMNAWVDNFEADDLWRHRANFDVTVMDLYAF